MSIPKVIHYCWFGQGPLPESVLRCMESWRTYCPDYKIIQWNEDNFDVNLIPYTKEAYSLKKWAFVSDYARLSIIYEHGGIYLDTDVELIRSLDPLLEYDAYMGFQDKELVASGLGFGSVAHHPVLRALMDDYDGLSFQKQDGTLDLTPCPDRNTRRLLALGLIPNGRMQSIQGMQILPADYLSPKDYRTGKLQRTSHTYSIHHYDASWLSKSERRWMRLQQVIGPSLYEKVRHKWDRLRYHLGRLHL